MDASNYAALSRQTQLLHEMQVVANNLANSNSTGFRQENLIFSEFLSGGDGDPNDTLSMTRAGSRTTSFHQGALRQTGGTFDFAIEGEGFFSVETAQGPKLTRAGNFSANSFGELANADGHLVLDIGSAPIFVPPDAEKISLGNDGTLSADGRPIGQIGVFIPEDPSSLKRESGTTFDYVGELLPSPIAKIAQGFVENSNVNPIQQITRMIEIQRAYEFGQSFLDAEDGRIRDALKSFIRR